MGQASEQEEGGMATRKVIISIDDGWLERARFEAFDDEGSNDAEHDLLVDIIEQVAADLGARGLDPQAGKRA
jgi:hypothetical protein